MKKEYYLYVGGQKVKVSEDSEDIYKVYWREREHEKYLEQVDRKTYLLFFSYLDQDGHFADNIIDESVDVEKIVECVVLLQRKKGKILDFKLFYKYFVFVDKGNFDIKKVLKRYIDVNVFVDIVCVSEK